MKNRLLFFLFFLTTKMYAQIESGAFPNLNEETGKKTSSEESSFNKYADHQSWVIKGKIIPILVPIPPGSGYNPSVGVEYGFYKNNSIGLDLTYYNYSFSQGDRYDSTLQTNVSNPRVQEINTGLLLSYRHYLQIQKLRDNGTVLYFGSFIRVGKLIYKPEAGYVSKSNVVREHHNSFGLMFGGIKELYFFKKIKKPLYIDAYFGVFVKQKELKREYFDQNNNLVKDFDYPTNIGIRVGLNFSIAFKRNRIDI